MRSMDQTDRAVPRWLSALVDEWINGFALAVREVDYERGREHFADHVVSFGTRTHVLSGIDELERAQWRGVWPYTDGFEFVWWRVVSWQLNADRAGLIVVAAEWTSTADSLPEDERRRVGRATLGLRCSDGGGEQDPRGLQCIHSHFSLYPTEWDAQA